MFVGILGLPIVRTLMWSQATIDDLALLGVFLGGVIGSALVAIAFYLYLFAPQRSESAFRKIIIIALVGGIAGSAGFALGHYAEASILKMLEFLQRGTSTNPPSVSPEGSSFFAMVIFWQAVVAPILLLSFPITKPSLEHAGGRSSLYGSDQSELSVWKKILAVAAFAFLLYMLLHGIGANRPVAN